MYLSRCMSMKYKSPILLRSSTFNLHRHHHQLHHHRHHQHDNKQILSSTSMITIILQAYNYQYAEYRSWEMTMHNSVALYFIFLYVSIIFIIVYLQIHCRKLIQISWVNSFVLVNAKFIAYSTSIKSYSSSYYILLLTFI